MLFKVATKSDLVQIGTCGISHRNHIGIDQRGTLEHALQFFAGNQLALVGTLFDPDAPLVVEIRFGDAVGNADDNDQSLLRLYVFCLKTDGRAHVLACRVAQHLIAATHFSSIQSGNGAVIIDTNQQRAASAVGKRHQFGGQCVRVANAALELLAAVLTQENQRLQLFGCHGFIAHTRLTVMVAVGVHAQLLDDFKVVFTPVADVWATGVFEAAEFGE